MREWGIPGEFVEILNWRWIYWLSAIFTLVILFFTWWGMPLHLLIKHCSLKVIGEEWRLKCLGLTLLYIGVVQGELLGWWDSGLVVSCLIGSAILMGTFIIRAYIYKQSFGHLNWIKDSNLRLCFYYCLFIWLFDVT